MPRNPRSRALCQWNCTSLRSSQPACGAGASRSAALDEQRHVPMRAVCSRSAAVSSSISRSRSGCRRQRPAPAAGARLLIGEKGTAQQQFGVVAQAVRAHRPGPSRNRTRTRPRNGSCDRPAPRPTSRPPSNSARWAAVQPVSAAHAAVVLQRRQEFVAQERALRRRCSAFHSAAGTRVDGAAGLAGFHLCGGRQLPVWSSDSR